MKLQRLVPGVLAVMTAMGCFNQPKINGDKLQCLTDDGCLAGYVCTKRPGDVTQGFGTCVKSLATGVDGSAADVASTEANSTEASAGMDSAPGVDGVIPPVDGAPVIDGGADKPAAFDLAADAPADTSSIQPVDGSADRNPNPDLPIVTTDAASPDLPLPQPDGPRTDAPITGTGGIVGTGGGSGIGTGGGLGTGGGSGTGTGGGSGTGGVPGTGGSSTPPVIDCGPLQSPLNGSVTALTTTVGSEANYACQTGYGPSGSSTRYCLATGLWSGVAPSCVIANCPGLPSPLHGVVSAPTLTYGSTATYTCEPGYNRVGGETRTCQPNGTWDGAEPACTAVDCGTLTAPTNGQITVPTTTYLSTATFTCDLGYNISSTTPRTCQADKSWSGSAPTCALVDCGALLPPANGNVSVTTTTYGSAATYSCSNGATLSGDTVRTCQADGNWSGSAPTCQCTNGKTSCNGACVDTLTDNSNCGGCGLVCTAVAPSTAQPCTAGRCLVTLASGQKYPISIVAGGTSVFWANHGSEADNSTEGSIMKVSFAGGPPVALASNQAQPWDLAIDAANVYWTNYPGSVRKVSLDGGPITTIANSLGATNIVVAANHVYWGSSDEILRAPTSGGSSTPFYSGQASGLAADGTYLYWTSNSTASIMRKPHGGGGSTTIISDTWQWGLTQAGHLAVDSTGIYWIGGGPVTKADLNGQNPEVLVQGNSNTNGKLVVDSNSVYWADAYGKVLKLPKGGGSPITLATMTNSVLGIAVDASSVYWVDYGSSGVVMKLTPK